MAQAKGKTWLRNHSADSFVKKAQKEGYRSRAVYKLQELDQRYCLLASCKTVVELGSAPGGWSQWIQQSLPKSHFIAIDVLPMGPLSGVKFIQGDFNDAKTQDQLKKALAGQKVDLVLSDMAPNITGIKSVDQPRVMNLAEEVFDFAVQVLRPGGNMLIKVFQGKGFDNFKVQLKNNFTNVVNRKPKASKLQSSETYILARNFRVV